VERLAKLDDYGLFLEAVDPVAVPDYADVVKQPMHFGAMRARAAAGGYARAADVEADLRLLVANAQLYNRADTLYYREASKVLAVGLARIGSVRAREEGARRERAFAAAPWRPAARARAFNLLASPPLNAQRRKRRRQLRLRLRRQRQRARCHWAVAAAHRRRSVRGRTRPRRPPPLTRAAATRQGRRLLARRRRPRRRLRARRCGLLRTPLAPRPPRLRHLRRRPAPCCRPAAWHLWRLACPTRRGAAR